MAIHLLALRSPKKKKILIHNKRSNIIVRIGWLDYLNAIKIVVIALHQCAAHALVVA